MPRRPLILAAAASRLQRASDCAFAKLAEKQSDVTKLPIPLQTVAVVVSAQGMIDNGGFPYFFENDWPGQPPYSLFADAYRRIGADDAARAIEQAVALFPFPDPHRSAKKRREILGQFDDERTDPFWRLSDGVCGNAAVWQQLQKYVDAEAAAFANA